MRILIDGVFFQLSTSGIARVWSSLLPLLAERDDLEIFLLDRGGAPEVGGVTRIPFPRYTGPFPADSLLIQNVCDQIGAEVFSTTYYSTPLRVPMVLLIYDMIPELFGFDMSHRIWMEKEIAIAFAQSHVCISHSTRSDLLERYPEIASDRVEVAWCGVDRRIFIPRAAEEIAEFRREHGLVRPYFLFVGSRVQHKGYKNSTLFFEALNHLKGTAFDILCVGGEPEVEPEILAGLPDGMRLTCVVLDDHQLSLAYGGATALVYPSLYEGFGMPVIEAMASGCPVITTSRGGLAEAAGNAAIVVEGTSVLELAEALDRVRDPNVQADLRARGLAHAAQFDWQPMADLLARQFLRLGREARSGLLDDFFSGWERLRRIQADVDI